MAKCYKWVRGKFIGLKEKVKEEKDDKVYFETGNNVQSNLLRDDLIEISENEYNTNIANQRYMERLMKDKYYIEDFIKLEELDLETGLELEKMEQVDDIPYWLNKLFYVRRNGGGVSCNQISKIKRVLNEFFKLLIVIDKQGYLVDEVDEHLIILEAEKQTKKRELDSINKQLKKEKDELKKGQLTGCLEGVQMTYSTYKKYIKFINKWVNEKREYLKNEEKEEEYSELVVTKDSKNQLDYSNTNGVQRVLFLYKLGVFDFLRTKEPFVNSTNKLSIALSGVTGIKSSTLQKYLNPMCGGVGKKNYLEDEKALNDIHQKLIDIDFKPEK